VQGSGFRVMGSGFRVQGPRPTRPGGRVGHNHQTVGANGPNHAVLITGLLVLIGPHHRTVDPRWS
jgi:hypothetical protein